MDSDRGRPRFDGATAAERRVSAAKENNLLLEMPSWGDDYELSPEAVAKFGLTPEEKAELEAMYRQFHDDAYRQLQKLYGDLVGNPEAGADSTLAALIHNLLDLSPQSLCRERILAVVAALAVGAPLPAPSPDAAPCEQAVLILFQMVDQLEQQAGHALGDRGTGALWSGTSSFQFSAEGSDRPK